MTQEEKSLLLKELCARLPYEVKCKWEHEYEGKTYTGGGILCDIDHVKTPNGYRYWDCYFEDEGDDIPIELVKPYLRPMSSMTEEEKRHVIKMTCLRTYDNGVVYDIPYDVYTPYYVMEDCLNYLRSIHIDYLGLIEKGLALEAPKGMYNLNK